MTNYIAQIIKLIISLILFILLCISFEMITSEKDEDSQILFDEIITGNVNGNIIKTKYIESHHKKNIELSPLSFGLSANLILKTKQEGYKTDELNLIIDRKFSNNDELKKSLLSEQRYTINKLLPDINSKNFFNQSLKINNYQKLVVDYEEIDNNNPTKFNFHIKVESEDSLGRKLNQIYHLISNYKTNKIWSEDVSFLNLLPKDNLYLFNRFFKIKKDINWRYTQDNYNVVLQKTFDEKILKDTALDFIFDRNIPLELINLRLKTKSGEVILNLNSLPKAITKDNNILHLRFFLNKLLKQYKDAVLTEIIIFLRGNIDEVIKTKPLHSISLTKIEFVNFIKNHRTSSVIKEAVYENFENIFIGSIIEENGSNKKRIILDFENLLTDLDPNAKFVNMKVFSRPLSQKFAGGANIIKANLISNRYISIPTFITTEKLFNEWLNSNKKNIFTTKIKHRETTFLEFNKVDDAKKISVNKNKNGFINFILNKDQELTQDLLFTSFVNDKYISKNMYVDFEYKIPSIFLFFNKCWLEFNAIGKSKDVKGEVCSSTSTGRTRISLPPEVNKIEWKVKVPYSNERWQDSDLENLFLSIRLESFKFDTMKDFILNSSFLSLGKKKLYPKDFNFDGKQISLYFEEPNILLKKHFFYNPFFELKNFSLNILEPISIKEWQYLNKIKTYGIKEIFWNIFKYMSLFFLIWWCISSQLSIKLFNKFKLGLLRIYELLDKIFSILKLKVSWSISLIFWVLLTFFCYACVIFIDEKTEASFYFTLGALSIVMTWRALLSYCKPSISLLIPKLGTKIYSRAYSKYLLGFFIFFLGTIIMLMLKLKPIAEQFAFISYFMLFVGGVLKILELKKVSPKLFKLNFIKK